MGSSYVENVDLRPVENSLQRSPTTMNGQIGQRSSLSLGTALVYQIDGGHFDPVQSSNKRKNISEQPSLTSHVTKDNQEKRKKSKLILFIHLMIVKC